MENSPTPSHRRRRNGVVYRIKEMPPGFQEALMARRAGKLRADDQPPALAATSFREIQMQVRSQLSAGHRAPEVREPANTRTRKPGAPGTRKAGAPATREPGAPATREPGSARKTRPQPDAAGRVRAGGSSSPGIRGEGQPRPRRTSVPQPHRAAPDSRNGAQTAQADAQRAAKRGSDKVLKVMMAAFSLVFVFAAYMFLSEYIPQVQAKRDSERLGTVYALPPVPVEGVMPDVNDPFYFPKHDFGGLKALNSEINAWIYVPGGEVNYAVVRGSDNDYYLRHTFEKKSNRAGSIFMDFRNNTYYSDQNTVVYGHAMKSGLMFGKLLNFRQQSTYEKYPFIVIEMEGVTYYYQIFSVNSLSADFDYRESNYGTYFEKWIRELRAGSLIDSSAVVTASSRVITLSTCINGLADGRLAVFGVLLNPEGQEVDLAAVRP